VGQYVNDGTQQSPCGKISNIANGTPSISDCFVSNLSAVAYMEFEYSEHLPLHSRRYIPVLPYEDFRDSDGFAKLPGIALVAVRDIQDEELFSTYMELAGLPE
jgi:hypothetical protein